jgi:exopolysaccharide production protein ExoQ
MESPEIGRKAGICMVILLAPIFFFMNHELDYSYEGSSIESSATSEETASLEDRALEGNVQRRTALFSLGVLSVLGMMFVKRRNRFQYEEPLVWALFFFGIWSVASVIWSIDVPWTLRKLLAFGIFCFCAVVLATRFSVDFLPECVFYLTGIFLLAGISVEIVSHIFQPWSNEYRFSGGVHPNVQAINCVMLLLGAVSLAERSRHRLRMFQWIAAAIALIFLILTKSRTSLLCALLALTITYIIKTPNKWKALAYLFGFACFGLILGVFVSEILATNALEMVLLGRETEETLTLTGRTSIWDTAMKFINWRPILGYGFNSFWTPPHIRAFSETMGWNISDAHSVYLDQLLSTGLVGLLSYSAILILGIKNSVVNFTKTREPGYGFLLMLFLFFSVHGFLESTLIQISSLDSFVVIWGLLYLAFLRPKLEEYDA